MSSIIAADSFDTLVYQQSLVATPLVEGAATGIDNLDVAQRAVSIGEVVPIVFCRRNDQGVGGVLLSPGATEARFENDTANAVTASYHLVLSEGEIDNIEVRDVFQRSCRVGTFSQTYGRRAGDWTPGNFIVDRFTNAEATGVNLFANSALPVTQSVTVTAQAYTLSFYGTGTITLSGASTAGPLVGTGDVPDRVSLTFTPTAGSLTMTLSGEIVQPRLETGTAATGSITTLPRPECPYYCGSGGTYQAMSTASFVIGAPPDDTRWNRQVHMFIRGGMHVPRLLTSGNGPSNNVADLILWLLRKTSRTPEMLIDLDAFEDAARFTDKIGFWFNGVLNQSSNLEDFIAAHARYFLLSKSKKGGKMGLRPLLPTTAGDSLRTSPVQPVYVFNEDNIIPGSFEISYMPLNERKPFCALMLWRQQPEDDIGIIRTTEVRYANTALEGPYEQHDLSAFAASEDHAVKVGTYILATRRYRTHTLRIKALPAAFNATLSQGDIVQVIMQRQASSAAPGEHRYLYEVDRIGKTRQGEVSLDLVHFPVDRQGRSLVALEVAAARGSGVLLSTTRSGITCDINSSTDTTIPPDTSLDPVEWDLPDDTVFEVLLPDTDFGFDSDGDGIIGGDGGGDGGPGSAEPGEFDPTDFDQDFDFDGIDGGTIDFGDEVATGGSEPPEGSEEGFVDGDGAGGVGGGSAGTGAGENGGGTPNQPEEEQLPGLLSVFFGEPSYSGLSVNVQVSLLGMPEVLTSGEVAFDPPWQIFLFMSNGLVPVFSSANFQFGSENDIYIIWQFPAEDGDQLVTIEGVSVVNTNVITPAEFDLTATLEYNATGAQLFERGNLRTLRKTYTLRSVGPEDSVAFTTPVVPGANKPGGINIPVNGRFTDDAELYTAVDSGTGIRTYVAAITGVVQWTVNEQEEENEGTDIFNPVNYWKYLKVFLVLGNSVPGFAATVAAAHASFPANGAQYTSDEHLEDFEFTVDVASIEAFPGFLPD
jgi:hypothetical protein